jgi:hypothetical protein
LTYFFEHRFASPASSIGSVNSVTSVPPRSKKTWPQDVLADWGESNKNEEKWKWNNDTDTGSKEKVSPRKQAKWSPEEDAEIIQLRRDGMKWEDISKHLPGRSAITCSLHYQNYLERRAEWDEDRKNKLARLYERYVKIRRNLSSQPRGSYTIISLYIMKRGYGHVTNYFPTKIPPRHVAKSSRRNGYALEGSRSHALADRQARDGQSCWNNAILSYPSRIIDSTCPINTLNLIGRRAHWKRRRSANLYADRLAQSSRVSNEKEESAEHH